jgi:hypothetical protein
MPQLQLPIFPADVTPINQQVAVSCESGKVVYVHGLLPERKQFLDTIKLISYRAETSMASVLRETMTRSDARALVRQIYSTEADLFPDAESKTLTVCLHHLTQAIHDQALRHLCDQLNATETIFPGTDLTACVASQAVMAQTLSSTESAVKSWPRRSERLRRAEASPRWAIQADARQPLTSQI